MPATAAAFVRDQSKLSRAHHCAAAAGAAGARRTHHSAAVVASGGGCASLVNESMMARRKERWCSRKEVTCPPGTHLPARDEGGEGG